MNRYLLGFGFGFADYLAPVCTHGSWWSHMSVMRTGEGVTGGGESTGAGLEDVRVGHVREASYLVID